ncbi:hypothetical protein M2275_002937 [Rhodococcus opacus]|nr:hypothetical protein [Rhodococcus opacus]
MHRASPFLLPLRAVTLIDGTGITHYVAEVVKSVPTPGSAAPLRRGTHAAAPLRRGTHAAAPIGHSCSPYRCLIMRPEFVGWVRTTPRCGCPSSYRSSGGRPVPGQGRPGTRNPPARRPIAAGRPISTRTNSLAQHQTKASVAFVAGRATTSGQALTVAAPLARRHQTRRNSTQRCRRHRCRDLSLLGRATRRHPAVTVTHRLHPRPSTRGQILNFNVREVERTSPCRHFGDARCITSFHV